MVFQELILLSTLSKLSNYMVKTQNFAWEPSLLDSAPSNYVKKSGSQALLKMPLTSFLEISARLKGGLFLVALVCLHVCLLPPWQCHSKK